MQTVTVTNPFSRAPVALPLKSITAARVEAWAQLLEDETLSRLEGADTPAHWADAFVSLVGPDAAGLVIIGS